MRAHGRVLERGCSSGRPPRNEGWRAAWVRAGATRERPLGCLGYFACATRRSISSWSLTAPISRKEACSSRAPRERPLSILVVDDDHSSREAAAKPFRDRGDSVRTASDGVDALAACLRDPPDVILSDVQMPRM